MFFLPFLTVIQRIFVLSGYMNSNVVRIAKFKSFMSNALQMKLSNWNDPDTMQKFMAQHCGTECTLHSVPQCLYMFDNAVLLSKNINIIQHTHLTLFT